MNRHWVDISGLDKAVLLQALHARSLEVPFVFSKRSSGHNERAGLLSFWDPRGSDPVQYRGGVHLREQGR
jgi:hypothetical protein